VLNGTTKVSSVTMRWFSRRRNTDSEKPEGIKQQREGFAQVAKNLAPRDTRLPIDKEWDGTTARLAS
jgi:hypothetical protein